MRKTLLILVSMLCSCRAGETVILYETDVHCRTEGYSRMAALKDSLEGCGLDVITVSCGDFLSGGFSGNSTEGGCIAGYMKAVGYDAVVPGNHDFDYGIARMGQLLDSIGAAAVCCNLMKKPDIFPYPGYTVIRKGGRSTAFIGVTTPTTLTTSIPDYFKDSTGEIVYGFCADSLAERVQGCVTAARKEGADAVILLAHLGDMSNPVMTTRELIASTTGIDAVLDGHGHHAIVHDTVNDKTGKPVILTSTGLHFRNIGILSIDRNGIKGPRLVRVSDIGRRSAYVDSIGGVYDSLYNLNPEDFAVGTTRCSIGITDAEGMASRSCETALGNLVADAFRSVTCTEIAFINSGALRSGIGRGTIGMNDIRRSMPFTDYVCKARLRGDDILDMLEMSSRMTPKANGGFMQVSGIRYSIDTSVESSVLTDMSGTFVKVGGGRRVHSVMTEEKDGTWAPLDTCRMYTAASIDFILHRNGDGIRLVSLKDMGALPILAPEAVRAYIGDSLRGNLGWKYARTGRRITFSPVPDGD